MHEHMDIHSPERIPSLRPRVLTFAASPEISNDNSSSNSSNNSSSGSAIKAAPKPLHAINSVTASTASMSNTAPSSACSPPYRKVRALRLFDTPTTPKTILQKSALNKDHSASKTLPSTSSASAVVSAGAAAASQHLLSDNTDNSETVRLFGDPRRRTGLTPNPLSKTFSHRAFAAQLASSAAAAAATAAATAQSHTTNGNGMHVHNKALDGVYANVANVNPFSPNSLAMRNKKRSRTVSQRADNGGIGSGAAGTAVAVAVVDPMCRSGVQQAQSMVGRRTVASLFSNYSVDGQQQQHTQQSDPELVQAPKRLALQDSNISRYEKEFLELARIGVGEFGYVYHCLNRLDGCDYAIKKSIKPVAGSVFEKTALNEVWAHAVLGKHDNVVRYYSAWAENNHMLIQNEYCNGGSLQNVLANGRILSEQELRTLLLHIASGLKYIHSNDLVHMDLKAGNIFLSRTTTTTNAGANASGSANGGGIGNGRRSSGSSGLRASTSSTEYCDDGFEDDHAELGGGSGANGFLGSSVEHVTYKIGDLGHVTSINDPQVEEGDCRYLPVEILREDFTHLCKADIFALGITLYEAGGGGALPKNGDMWHELRNGRVPDLPRLSREFNDLIKLMTHPDPLKRPSSTSIFYHPVLYSVESKTKAQLMHELQLQRQKNDILTKKLRENALLLKSYEMAGTPNAKKISRVQPNNNNSPRIATSDRKLRSYSRKTSLSRQRSARGVGLRSSTLNANSAAAYRDQNKNNVVGEINFFL